MKWYCRGAAVALVAAMVLLTAGCPGERTSTEKRTSKRVSPAYARYFGEAPTPQEGECFARVGFLPLSAEPGRLAPFPLFLFTAEGQLPLLLERLILLGDFLPPGNPFADPFPLGTSVASATLNGSTASIDLIPGAFAPGQLAQAAAALTETAAQFAGVERVLITLSGAPLPDMPENGFAPDPSRRSDPGPPRLLMIAGTWDRQKGGPQELLVNFDRPVRIDHFELKGTDGLRIDGEYYQGAFDMAVALHPARPEGLKEDLLLQVSWEVTDRLGRSAGGEDLLPLRRIRQSLGEFPLGGGRRDGNKN